ncbi:hypothetical protein MU462_14470, partial [Staphylococcus aureus]
VSQCWVLSKSCVVNWDAWAAVGTVLAVVVALLTSQSASREAKRVRSEQSIASAAAARDRAVSRLLVLDQELFMFGGEIARIKRGIRPDAVAVNSESVGAWIRSQLPDEPLQMLQRFAGDLDAIGKQESAILISVLASWYALRNELRATHWEDADASIGGQAVSTTIGAYDSLLEAIREARTITMKWASEVRDGLPETDF